MITFVSANISTFQTFAIDLKNEALTYLYEQPWLFDVSYSVPSDIILAIPTFDESKFVCPSPAITYSQCIDLKNQQTAWHNTFISKLQVLDTDFITQASQTLETFTGVPYNAKHTYLQQYVTPIVNDQQSLMSDIWLFVVPSQYLTSSAVSVNNQKVTTDKQTLSTDLNTLAYKAYIYSEIYAYLQMVVTTYLTKSSYASAYDNKAHGITISANIAYYTQLMQNQIGNLWKKEYDHCHNSIQVNMSNSVQACVSKENNYIVANSAEIIGEYAAQLISSSMLALQYTSVTDFVLTDAVTLYNEINTTWVTTLTNVMKNESLGQKARFQIPSRPAPPHKSKDYNKSNNSDDDEVEDLDTELAEEGPRESVNGDAQLPDMNFDDIADEFENSGTSAEGEADTSIDDLSTSMDNSLSSSSLDENIEDPEIDNINTLNTGVEDAGSAVEDTEMGVDGIETAEDSVSIAESTVDILGDISIV